MSSYRISRSAAWQRALMEETASSSSHTRAEVLGAWLMLPSPELMNMTPTSPRATEARPWLTYEERRRFLSPAGPWKLSCDRSLLEPAESC